LKIFKFGKFSIFFLSFPFLFFFFSLSFLLFSFLSLLFPSRTEQRSLTHRSLQATNSTEDSRTGALQPSPCSPPSMGAPPAAPRRPRLPLLPSSFPSPVTSSNSGHGRLPWRALHKLIFLHGMIKMDAYDLPLAIPTLNFI
jgi:hypothetical protein